MGRLTLNVLLSFAQFEREVTGERIRDKIAASKKKGMWMSGNVPLGYDASERTPVLNPAEAETVRRIFALYRELGCVRRVKEEADRLGLRTKCSTTADGTERGGKPLTRGHLYGLLSNPIYARRIAHKGELYSGQEPALIDDETWTTVRNQLAANASDHHRKAKAAEPSLLAGLLVDARGERLTLSHAIKKGRWYRYYVSAALITEAGTNRTQGRRIVAREIEEAVVRILIEGLISPAKLVERFGTAGIGSDQIRKMLGRAAHRAATHSGPSGERAKLVRGLVEKVVVDDQSLTIKLRCGPLLGRDVPSSASEDGRENAVELAAAIAFKRRGPETKLVLPGLAQQNDRSRCDPALIKAIARGRTWFEELATGRVRSLQELARRDGITRRYIRRLVGLAFLSPQLVEAILQGRQSGELTAARLTELDLPLDWDRAAQTTRELTANSVICACPRPQPSGRPVRIANSRNFQEVGLHHCGPEKNGQGAPVRSRHVPSHVPSHAQTAAKVRRLSPTAPAFTTETDSALEEEGFEPLVPLGGTLRIMRRSRPGAVSAGLIAEPTGRLESR
jgi:site-specific DNA recombinase